MKQIDLTDREINLLLDGLAEIITSYEILVQKPEAPTNWNIELQAAKELYEKLKARLYGN